MTSYHITTPTPQPASLPAIATRSQLAAFLQVSEDHIANMVKRGRIPRVTVGRAVRFNTAQVLAVLQQEGASR